MCAGAPGRSQVWSAAETPLEILAIYLGRPGNSEVSVMRYEPAAMIVCSYKLQKMICHLLCTR